MLSRSNPMLRYRAGCPVVVGGLSPRSASYCTATSSPLPPVPAWDAALSGTVACVQLSGGTETNPSTCASLALDTGGDVALFPASTPFPASMLLPASLPSPTWQYPSTQVNASPRE